MSNQEAEAQQNMEQAPPQHHKVSGKMRDFYRHGGFSQVHSRQRSNTTPEEYDAEYWEKMYPHHPYYSTSQRQSNPRHHLVQDVPTQEQYDDEYYRKLYGKGFGPDNADIQTKHHKKHHHHKK